MRPADFFTRDEALELFLGERVATLNEEMLEELRRRPLAEKTDLDVALPLARLVHDELRASGTGGGGDINDDDSMQLAIQALQQTVRRLGINFKLPFRDLTAFHTWWVDNGAYGSWQARRDLLSKLFEPLHDQLADMELATFDARLVDPIPPHARTGWSAVDTEISELRKHFNGARTPQDYRAVGLDCVAVTEALSATVYDSSRHLRSEEEEPPVAKTKLRLERFIEDSAPGPDDAALRKLARAAIEYAQHVKHSETPTRREAGIAADAVIQLANMLRRLDEPD